MKTLMALVDSPDHVCCRYRLAAYIPAMEAQGWRVTVESFAHGTRDFFMQARRLRSADIVLLQRKLIPFWKRRWLRGSVKKLVFDLDDAVFMRDSNSSKAPHSIVRSMAFRGVIKSADLVLCGNSFLVEAAARYSAVNAVHMPTAVPVEEYPVADHMAAGEHLTAVWIGSAGTAVTLRDMDRVLPRNLPSFTLKIISDVFPDLYSVVTQKIAWNIESEKVDIASSSIGVSWLPEHPWSYGKCGLKVLQYMAAGLPVIANPVGIHNTFIQHGHNGFLASSAAEWHAAIAALRSPLVRKRMGLAGRDFTMQSYNTRQWASQLIKTLDKL